MASSESTEPLRDQRSGRPGVVVSEGSFEECLNFRDCGATAILAPRAHDKMQAFLFHMALPCDKDPFCTDPLHAHLQPYYRLKRRMDQGIGVARSFQKTRSSRVSLETAPSEYGRFRRPFSSASRPVADVRLDGHVCSSHSARSARSVESNSSKRD